MGGKSARRAQRDYVPAAPQLWLYDFLVAVLTRESQWRPALLRQGMTLIAPYDDLDVIAGQATVGLEVLHQAPRALGAIFIPIGGGGLAAGIASVVKELRPEIRLIGVQAEDSDAMARSIAAKRRVRLDHVGIFADGVAVKEVGTHTFDICRWALDEVVTVTTDEICAA